MASQPLSVGVIGCGAAAVPVCEALAAAVETRLAMTYDANGALAQDLAERFGAAQAHTLDEVLSSPAVAAVYIAVPHHLLAGLSAQALRAGKHVLVEKPMATRLADADDLIQLAEARGRVLDVFYEMRHVQPYAQARQIVQAGELGQIIGVRVQTLIDKPLRYWQAGYAGRPTTPWRGQKAQAGGGVTLMNSSHALDAVRYVTGLEVVRVSAEVGTLAAEGVEVEDTAAATLRFSNGAVGSLMAGAHIAGARGEERFEIYGTHGQLRLPDPYAGSRGLEVYLTRDGAGLTAGAWHTLPCEPTPVHQRAVEQFARAAASSQPTTAGARAARQVLATVLALYQAAEEQRAVAVPGVA